MNVLDNYYCSSLSKCFQYTCSKITYLLFHNKPLIYTHTHTHTDHTHTHTHTHTQTTSSAHRPSHYKPSTSTAYVTSNQDSQLHVLHPATPTCSICPAKGLPANCSLQDHSSLLLACCHIEKRFN